MVPFPWKGLREEEDSLEPPTTIFQNVPAMVEGLLRRKNTPTDIGDVARSVLVLSNGGMWPKVVALLILRRIKSNKAEAL